jgi:membrane protease YdiL (CAAX protease family)
VDPKRTLPAWRDLILYLVIGAGGFVAASWVASRFVSRGSLGVSLLAYAINFVFFAGAALLAGVARGKLSLRELGFIPPRITTRLFFGAIALSLALLPLRGLIGVIVQFVAGGGSLQGLEGRMQVIAPGGVTWSGFLATLLCVGILVPIAEELFFRGALFTWFRQRFNFPLALLASSLLFALGHADTIGVVASAFVLAVVNAWALERTRMLWVPILMHMTTNTVAVLIIYAAPLPRL